ncbi:hypothetical protein FACS1894211_10650 [Clostridia bacterium]|nr:hypothetical protein FACS1894211_10650 [Clostridia bacterium]
MLKKYFRENFENKIIKKRTSQHRCDGAFLTVLDQNYPKGFLGVSRRPHDLSTPATEQGAGITFLEAIKGYKRESNMFDASFRGGREQCPAESQPIKKG